MIKMLFGAVAATAVLAGANMAVAQTYDDYQSRDGYQYYPDQRGDYRSTYGEQHHWDSRDGGEYRGEQNGDGWSWAPGQHEANYGGDRRWDGRDQYRRHARRGRRFDDGGYHGRDQESQWNWEIRLSPGYDRGY